MKLLIDIGNSRIKWATVVRGKLCAGTAVPRPATEHDLAACASELWGELEAPKRIVASNVAGAAYGTALDAWLATRWNTAAQFVVAQAKGCGVTNAYTVPERLGPDRWAALIAGQRRSNGTPACVIDAGTALTIDILAADGVHQGGLIIPGRVMMRRALLERTGEIGAAAADPAQEPVTLLARDTRDGVEGGALYTQVAVIDRVVADVSAELGQRPLCLISGGGAGDLLPLLAGDYHHVPDLVLEGLAIIAEKS